VSAGAVLLLAAALFLDVTGFRFGPVTPDVFMWSGLALLLLAAFLPDRSRRCRVSLYKHVPHPHIAHRREAGPAKVADVLERGSPVTRFNTRAAVFVTRTVGTMWCAYAFTVLAFYGLPAGLHAGAAGFVQWASSQFIQLVLLPIIIVGSAVLAEASDRMAKRQFDDVEALLHGQSEQAAHLAAQDDKIIDLLEQVKTNTDLTAQVHALVAEMNERPERLAPGPGITIAGTSDAQVKQLTDMIQAALLQQAKRNPPTAPRKTGS
jgi:hypothetical protein